MWTLAEIQSEMARRAIVIANANTTERRAHLAAFWAENPIQFQRDTAWGYDPRNTERGLPSLIPMMLWPKQEEYLTWLHHHTETGLDHLTEKSRDQGATTLNTMYDLHRWRFSEGYSAGYGSRKLSLVDSLGDPDSIFEKLRILYRNWPQWLIPNGFREDKHDKSCLLINPANGSTISGEGGDEIGRGGRKSRYTLDEHSRLPNAEQIDAALSNNTTAIHYLATPNGMGNLYAQKRFSGRIPVFTLHWRDDPRKDDVWYAQMCRQYSPAVVAQEVDIDYNVSTEGAYIPAKWVAAAVGLALYPGVPRMAGLDVADSGDNETVLITRHGGVCTRVMAWNGVDTTQSAYRAERQCRLDGVHVLQYDRVGVGAGIHGTLTAMDDTATKHVKVRHIGINAGDACTRRVYPDDPNKAKDRFANLKAEMWWALRLRFQRTWEHVNGEREHPHDDLIGIPDDTMLRSQISMPRMLYTERGKIQVEPKKALARRGIASPDRADALVLAYWFQPRGYDWL